MRYDMSLLRRFLAKLVHDVLPAALASLIGGFLITHYQLGRSPAAVARAAPASAEMMQLLRDEHGLVVNFVKAQVAKQEKQLAAEDSAPRVPADAEPPAAAPARQVVVAVATLRPTAARGKTPVVGASLAPLVIAQAQADDGAKAAASNSDMLLAKTIGIKDHVVAVTHRVVSAIGGIPSWIGAIGDRIGGEGTIPRPPADLVRAS